MKAPNAEFGTRTGAYKILAYFHDIDEWEESERVHLFKMVKKNKDRGRSNIAIAAELNSMCSIQFKPDDIDTILAWNLS